MGHKHRSSTVPLRRSAELIESLESRLLMARTFGIDVSDWQGNIDWTQVAAGGKTFAFIRATRGGTTGTYDEVARTGTLSQRYDDTKLLANVASAKAAGLLVGVYHFARPDVAGNTGADEATHFLQVAGDFMGDGYLPPVLDLEAGATSYSKAGLTDWALEFCQTIYDATGVTPIVYANSSYANSSYANSEVDPRLSEFPLWLARPAGTVNPATGNPPAAAGLPNVYGVWQPYYPQLPNLHPWSFWQYSSTGKVSGISGNVDLDVFNGDLQQLKEEFLGGYIPPSDVSTTLTFTAGTQVFANGDSVDYGTALKKGVAPVMTFTVTNTGTEVVRFQNFSVPAGFTATDPLVPYLLPGSSDTFAIRMNTTAVGAPAGPASFDVRGPVTATFTLNLSGVVDALPANTGAVYGAVYDDRTGDGVRQAGEVGVPGWQVYADLNKDGVRQPSEPITTTSATGEYVFNGLAAGPVAIRPIIPAGWFQTSPGPSGFVTINVLSGLATRAKDYGMARPGSISGRLFVDANKNGKRDLGEAPLAGWAVYVDKNNNGKWDDNETKVSADASGFYLLNNLRPGTYTIRTALPTGYARTTTSAYVLNIFSGTDISDKDFGFRA